MTRRWIILVATLPVAIAMLLLALKLFSLPIQAGAVQAAYERGDGIGAVDAAEPLHGTNWFEPWIAHFDRGTGYAADQYYVEAIDDFEHALELAPEDKRCQVSVNLALSWELLGDSYVEGGFYQGAVLLYDTARKVLEAAGPDCVPPEQQQPDERDADQEHEEAEERVEQKQRQAEEQRDLTQDPDDPSQADERQEQLEELQDQGQQSDQERENQENRDRGEESGGGFTDQPW